MTTDAATISSPKLIYPKKYADNIDYRIDIARKSDDSKFRALIAMQCRDDVKFFFNTFLWTFDPRPDAAPNNLPFITYDYEDDFIDWLLARIGRRDGLVEKSRDMGVTWTILGVFLHHWLFKDAFLAHLGSKTEDDVDRSGDPKSLFEKLRYFLKTIPAWLLAQHETRFMRLVNENGNTITGESANPNFARAGRYNVCLVDEYAAVEYADDIWTSMSNSTPSRIVASCVEGSTIVFTDQGLVRIKDLQFEKLGFSEGEAIGIYGRYGIKKTNLFYNSGVQRTKKINTNLGYNIESSHIHPFLSLNDDGELLWKKAAELKIGNYIAVQYGQECFGNKDEISDFSFLSKREWVKNFKKFNFTKIDCDLSYFMGLFLAEGYIHQGCQITISSGDEDIHNWLNEKYNFKRQDKFHSRLSNTNLCNFLYWFGFNKEKARNKIIPDRLFKLSRENVVNFIRGMFDGDGCSYYKKSKNNALKVLYWSTSKQIIDTLQIILLNFGIICSQSWTLTKPTKKVKVSSYCGKIEIGLGYSKKFMELIGFKLQRKNKESRKCVIIEKIPNVRNRVKIFLKNSGRGIIFNKKGRCGLYNKKRNCITRDNLKDLLLGIDNKNREYDELLEISNLNVYWAKITKIEDGLNSVYDFHIKDGHSFTGNGFIGHNTPRGTGNRFWKLRYYEMPKEDIKTLHWTLHPKKSIGLYVDSEGTKKYSCKGKKRSPWYDMECERNSAQIIAQELDIDYLASGNPYFDLQAVSKQEEWILSDETAGLGKYEIGLLARVDGKIKFRPNRNGLIRIYEHPGPLTQATAVCDPAEGLEHGDKTAIAVRCKKTGNLLAACYGKIAPDEAGELVKMLSLYYNGALCGAEQGGYGLVINQFLWEEGCNVFRDVETRHGGEKEGKKLGFNTKRHRAEMLKLAEEEIRNDAVEIRDRDLKTEMLNFINKDGKAQAAQGACDDFIFAWSMAGMMANWYPYSRRIEQGVIGKQRSIYGSERESTPNMGFSFAGASRQRRF